ncbi:PKD domain-containing protein [Thermococcus sp. SY098]|uniref:PKD domain-containing protein n=1 Tax=Thermococcus sp. SY098 TaxID=3111325 RepID=UPI002D7719EB|nr:PKD domain-containing protein [Thermococcus sp. SY098]WRS53533.1 PKD domain-containing protein [Thermococcus sp. SY098]
MNLWRKLTVYLVFLALFSSFAPEAYAGDADLTEAIPGAVIKDEEIIVGDRGDHLLMYEDEKGDLLYQFSRNYEMWDEITAGDVNGDGKAEIIHGDRDTDKLYILTRSGQMLRKKNVGFEAGDDIVCGDVNKDGKDEIIFADRNDWIKVYDENFNELSKFKIDFSDEDAIASGDIDGDGKDEIIWGDHSKNLIIVYDMYGNSIMSFSTDDYFDLTGRDEIAVGDVNLDGIGEIVVATQDKDNYGKSKGIHVFKVAEGKAYEISSFRIEYAKGDRMVIGDVNRDVVDEIVWASRTGKIKVYNYQGELINGPNGFSSRFEYGAGLAVGDVDGNSITVGPPIHSTMSITNKVIAVINAPPVDFDVINETGVFYATYMTKNTRALSVSVKAVSDFSFSLGVKLGVGLKGVAESEVRLKAKVQQKFEATRGNEHMFSETYDVTADMADGILHVSTDYDVYEFPIISPPELAVINGEQQYILVTVPKGKPHIHLSNYNSDIHRIGDITTYPTRPEDLPNYEVNNELFHYTIEVGKVKGGGGFYMKDANWRETKNTFSVSVSMEAKASGKIGLFGSYEVNLQGNYGKSKITTHKVSISNETRVHIEYNGRIEDRDKWYNATAIAYLDSEDGHLVLEFIVPSMGSYYKTRSLSPLGFSYDQIKLISKPLPRNIIVPPLVLNMFGSSCKIDASHSSGKAPLKVDFQISTSGGGGVKNWTLNFGDGTVLRNTGNVSTLLSHTYSEEGNYRATMNIENLWGYKANCSKEITVLPNKAPKAMFNISPSPAKVEDEIEFMDSSKDEDGSIVKWNWNFGDGTTSTERNPKHSYSSPGMYTVTLTVEDDSGMKASYSKSITINPKNQLPTADFTFLPKEPKAEETVNFVDKSYDSDGNIVSWNWDFGDGTTSTEREPTHTYSSPGNYTVRLVVKDDKGGEDEIAINIVVKAAPTPTETETTSSKTETPTESIPTSPTTTSTSTTSSSSASSPLPTETQTGTCGPAFLVALMLLSLFSRKEG